MDPRKEGSEQAAGSPAVSPPILESCRALAGLWLAGWLVANGFQAVLHVGRGCEDPTGMEEEIRF